MIQALVVTLREGVEAALVIGIAVAFLTKARRPELMRWVYSALAAAVAASLALGHVFWRWKWNQEKFEGWVMLAAAALVATLVFTMWRAGKTLKAGVERGLAKALASPAAGPSLGVFVFLMVLREGVETVLLLAALGVNSEDLWTAGGTALGLGLAVVFGVLFVRGSVRVDLRRFFRMTTAILAFVAFQLLVSGVHELTEQGVVPTTREIMSAIGPIVRNQAFFLVAILALATMMVLLDWRSRAPAAAAATSGPERRLAEWTARRERLWVSLICTASFVFIVLVTAEFIYAKSRTELSVAQEVSPASEFVRIPVADLADGDLHRYSVATPAGRTRFFLIQRPGLSPGVVLDACEICGDNGYYKEKANVICRNCGAAIYIPSIGLQGGCNPIPLEHKVENGEVLIPLEALAKGARIFAPHQGHH